MSASDLTDLATRVGLDVAVARTLAAATLDDPSLHRRALLIRVDAKRRLALVRYSIESDQRVERLVDTALIGRTWAELLSRYAVRADTGAAHAAARAARRAEFDREFVNRTFSQW